MDSRTFISHMAESMRPTFAASVLPIWSSHADLPIQVGTGTLLRVGDRRFLVTAEHVTALATQHDYPLYISDALPGAANLQLEGPLKKSKRFDVSVLELRADIVARLPNRVFLTTGSFERTEARPKDGWYIVHGYPHESSKVDNAQMKGTATSFTYGTHPYRGDTSNLENYDAEVHFLLAYSRQGADSVTGEIATGPSNLEGISGSSIWHTIYPGVKSSNWTPDDAKVVGVQTCLYRKSGAIRFTKWWVVNQIIRDSYPDLAYALDIWSPSHRHT